MILTKIFFLLAFIASWIQIYLATKKMPHYIGAILPFIFGAIGFGFMFELITVGIFMQILAAYMIPSIFLFCLFELTYWRCCWEKERRQIYEG